MVKDSRLSFINIQQPASETERKQEDNIPVAAEAVGDAGSRMLPTQLLHTYLPSSCGGSGSVVPVR